MKLLCAISFLFASAVAVAAPFGQLENISTQRAVFLADKLVQKQPITYCVQKGDFETVTAPLADLTLQTQAALNEWTRGVALHIEAAGRSKEFADIISLLKGAKFTEVPCDLSKHPAAKAFFLARKNAQEADITVLASSAYCEGHFHRTSSFYTEQMSPAKPFICLQTRYASIPSDKENLSQTGLSDEQKDILTNAKKVLSRTTAPDYSADDQRRLWVLNRLYSYDGPTYLAAVTHEMGHAFGLADEYTGLSVDPLYKTAAPVSGIMKRLYDPLGCSEVDGMITLLDRYTHTPRTFTSFCGDGVTFVSGVQKVAKNTPTKLRVRPGVLERWSLTPSSPTTKAMLYESVRQADALDDHTRTAAASLGTADEIYSRGFMKAGEIRHGSWLFIARQGKKYKAARVQYNASGRVAQVRLVQVTPTQAAKYFAEMKTAENASLSVDK